MDCLNYHGSHVLLFITYLTGVVVEIVTKEGLEGAKSAMKRLLEEILGMDDPSIFPLFEEALERQGNVSPFLMFRIGYLFSIKVIMKYH